MGGVTGPCPSCQVLLKAPFSMPQPFEESIYRQPTPAPAAPDQFYYAPPVAPPAPIHAAPPAAPREPIYQAPPAPAYTAPQTPQYSRKIQPLEGERPVLRQEPRALPGAGIAPAPARVRAEPSGMTKSRNAGAGSPPRREYRKTYLRVLVPLIFLGTALCVAYGVKSFLIKDHNAYLPDTGVREGQEERGVKRILEPEDESPGSLAENKRGQETPPREPEPHYTLPIKDPILPEKEPNLQIEKPPMPPISDNTQDTPPVTQPAYGGVEALAVLEKFLEMETLEERMPLIETKRPMPELQSSILNGPLPKDYRIEVDVSVPSNAENIEKATDFYYIVNFAKDGGSTPPPQTMLVRTRGTSPPKVVVDPFLDLYGGRFARFAEKPVKDEETFQVIIWVGASCNEDIPGAENKHTLKVTARNANEAIANVYCGKNSDIGNMFKAENSWISYGETRPCTILLRWNTQDDPEKPYIEALAITALDWNP